MQHTKGFTLIELLVVISIIGVLSSVVLASLASARLKARDAAVKAEVLQFRVLLEENYNDYGSYLYLQPQAWVSGPSDCGSYFTTGNYAAEAVSLCTAIFNNNKNSSANFMGPSTSIFFGNAVSQSTNYSVMAWLPSKGNFFCIGNSGANSMSTTASNAWGQPGCYSTP
jgi:prepilin-type N-terminal cleavage/methylation domain-containing protein